MTDEDDKGFKVKVTDRRRFTSEGDVRNGAREDAPEPAPAPAPAPEPAKPTSAQTEQPPPDPARGDRPPMDFLTFVASLATNALAALGMLPKEQAHGMPVNPELGREYIEILGMLQDKTRGNLTPEEEQGLGRIVSDLRMAYVELSKRMGAQ